MSPVELGRAEHANGLVAMELGEFDALYVDQASLGMFAELTGGRQASVGKAQTWVGTPIARAYLSIALVPTIASKISTVGFGGARLNCGGDRVRFGLEVCAGSALCARAKPAEVFLHRQGTDVKTEHPSRRTAHRS